MTSPLASVVIPNWNGVHHLPTCLDSLRAQTYRTIEVIVVDNASTDGSPELLEKEYPEVRVIPLPENRGFTGACNAGIEVALGTYILLLNNDTESEPTWVEAVVDTFSRHPEAGMVASKIKLFDRRDHIHAAGDFYGLDGIPGNRGVWERDKGQYDVEEYVFGACGGAAGYRSSLFDEIGLLDDDFFFSCEDVDLAWRAQMRGWRCIYTPDAVVYHHLAATGGGATASFYVARNTIYVLVKDYPAPLLRKYWPLVLRAQMRRALDAIRSWRGRAARATLRGLLAGMAGFPKMLRKRSEVQSSRSVDIDYLESILMPPK